MYMHNMYMHNMIHAGTIKIATLYITCMYVGRTSGVLVYNARQMFQHCLDEQDLILIYCKMISLLKNSEQKFASSLPQGI